MFSKTIKYDQRSHKVADGNQIMVIIIYNR